MRVQSTDHVSVAVHDLGVTGHPDHLPAPRPASAPAPTSRWPSTSPRLGTCGHSTSTVTATALRPDGDRYDWDGAADDLQAVLAEIADGPIDAVGH